MSKDLMLVGSIPYDTVEEVFRTFGAGLGAHLAALPDGEVGPRKHWVSKVHFQVMAGHPEFEILRQPAPENGVERLNPRNHLDSWLFKVKDGVDHVRFGDPGWRLGYARDALNSYFVFKTLREKGVLATNLRFQVSIPSVISVIAPRVFPTPGDLEKIRPGYLEAVHAELLGRPVKTSNDARKAAQLYTAFVAEGKGVPLWETGLRAQIYLGDSGFVKRLQTKSRSDQTKARNLPKARRVATTQKLPAYLARRRDRDSGIADAYRKGGYTMTAIADHVGLSISQVSRIIRNVELRQYQAAT